MVQNKVAAAVFTPKVEDLRVLVVDDQPNSLHIIRDMLTSLGVRNVITAPGGAEALRQLRERGTGFDAILCDWRMPEMSGLEFLRTVRCDDTTIPFIMVTGTADPTSVLAAKDCGVSGYLKKPFSREELSRKLTAIARVKLYRS